MPGLPSKGGGLGFQEGGQSFFLGRATAPSRATSRWWYSVGAHEDWSGTHWAEIRGSKALFLKSPAVLASRWEPWLQGTHLSLISSRE